VINPDPAVNPAKNPRRVGVPNHHHSSGSGENLMVDANPEPSRPAPVGAAVDGSLVRWVLDRVIAGSHRFLSMDGRGRFTVSLDRLAVLVVEFIAEYGVELHTELEQVRVEAECLARELAECRARVAGCRDTATVPGSAGGAS
jgi:hypothetical protein